MIDGLKVQFTTDQLKRHIHDLAMYYEGISDTCVRLLETRMVGAKPHVRKYVSECAKSNKVVSRYWAEVAACLPDNETFRFAVSNTGFVHEIHWPLGEESSDDELVESFERNAHHAQHPGSGLAALFGGGIPVGVTPSRKDDDDDAPDSEEGGNTQ